MFKVAKAKKGDIAKFYNLFFKTLNDGSFLYPAKSVNYIISAYNLTEKQLTKEILSGERQLYVARNKDDVIGYLLTNKEKAGVAFGHWLGIDNKFRRKGLGSRLLKIWEEDVRKAGVHSIHLWTMENDIWFYKKNNFVLVGKFENAWFGIDHFLFYKVIGTPNPKRYI